MEHEAERSLIRKSADGDQQAFRQLVEQHQAFAYRLAFRFIGEEQMSEDIVQDAFIRVWKNLNRYNEVFRFKTWLGKIVTNLCLDHRKSIGNRLRAAWVDSVPEPSQNEDNLEANELREIIRRLTETLTGKQKAVFVLRDLEMLNSEEVCAMLDMGTGTLKSNLYHARLKIKEGLVAYYRERVSMNKQER